MSHKLPPSEVAALLAKAALLDERKIDKLKAVEFAKSLDPMTLADATAAIERHRATSTDWLMPAHINAIVTGWKRDRLQRAPLEIPPAALADHPELEREWVQRRRELIADGYPAADAETVATEQITARTPAAFITEASNG
ncbi:hypothetical protein [Timonella senegalensis]|uniref:hypothetical protein n=1 Tax=Timonella senegalensis TaxID=1465825 RepID=UPI0003175268|nr:hypothetical protein [Timonella senegalensis]